MKVVPTAIEGALLIVPKVFGDDRGFFMESWNARAFADAGLDLNFVQDNHSRSSKGVLRGLHYQRPNPQGKMVRVTAGAVWDVALDVRRSSPTFGQWAGFELSAANRHILWVPPGIAHGFLCLEDGTDFLYKCTAFYDPANEHTILWNEVIEEICRTVDAAFSADPSLAGRFPEAPAARGAPSASLKRFVTDRQGHDRRYTIDEQKIRGELGYAPKRTFAEGFAQTLARYLTHVDWWRPLHDKAAARYD